MEGGPFSRDGIVNLAAGSAALISYDFLSPGWLAAWDREADLQRDLMADYRLELSIAVGRVAATVTRGRPLNVRVPPTGRILPLGELLARERAKGFPDRPFYVGSLRYLPPDGWQWQLHTPPGRDSFPRLHATPGELNR